MVWLFSRFQMFQEKFVYKERGYRVKTTGDDTRSCDGDKRIHVHIPALISPISFFSLSIFLSNVAF